MKKVIFLTLAVLLYTAAVSFVTFSLSGCKTFSPVQIKGQPDECNDMYSVMRLVAMQDNKGNELVTFSWQECMKARKELAKKAKSTECSSRIFGKNQPINKNEFKLYSEFLDCIKE